MEWIVKHVECTLARNAAKRKKIKFVIGIKGGRVRDVEHHTSMGVNAAYVLKYK